MPCAITSFLEKHTLSCLHVLCLTGLEESRSPCSPEEGRVPATCGEDRPSSTMMLPLAADVSVHVGHGYASKLTLASKKTDVGWSATFNTASCVMLSEQSDWLDETPARRLQRTVACTGICATGSGDRPELATAQTVQVCLHGLCISVCL